MTDGTKNNTKEIDTEVLKILVSIKEEISSSRKENEDGRAALVKRLDHLDGCVDTLKEELRKEKAFTHDTVKHEYERLGRKISSQDDEIRRLKRIDDNERDKLMHISETSLEHDATLGLAIGHIGKIEERLGHVEDKQDKSNEAVGAIVEELGIESKVQLGRTLPPGVKTPASSLTRISKENKGSLIATVATTFLIVVQIIWKILEVHR